MSPSDTLGSLDGGVPAMLALEDGTVFEGESLGALGTVTGEVCFNTSMTGYQEVLTDPSYHGQIVALTAPHIGNTGTNHADAQAARPWAAGLVVREASTTHCSWRAAESLHGYLERHGVIAITEVDTRRLTRHIRGSGALRGALSSEVGDPGALVALAGRAPEYSEIDLVSGVTTAAPRRLPAAHSPGRAARRVAVLDLGVKRKLIELVRASGCEVTVWPATTPADDILSLDHDGVLLSNGPGDPAPLEFAAQTAASIVGHIPVFGICLGHQVLALALGAGTFKLPFGHRGGNHPVRRVDDGRVEITCQNHGFAVDERSLRASGARITHVNLNDRTVEGFELPGVALAVQYHPESAPGPRDARYLFRRFVDLMDSFPRRGKGRPLPAAAWRRTTTRSNPQSVGRS